MQMRFIAFLTTSWHFRLSQGLMQQSVHIVDNNYTQLEFHEGPKCLSGYGKLLISMWKIGVFVPEMSEPGFYVLIDGNGGRVTIQHTRSGSRHFVHKASSLFDAATTKPEPQFQNPALNLYNCSITCTEKSSVQTQIQSHPKSRSEIQVIPYKFAQRPQPLIYPLLEADITTGFKSWLYYPSAS